MASFLFLVFAVQGLTLTMASESESDYLRERHRVLKTEKALFLGGNIKLNSKEIEINKIILKEKSIECARGHENISEFLPAQHFFKAKGDIEKSNVFAIIRNIPKGASLHTHLLAAASVDFIMENITRRDNLYGCYLNDTFKLRFLSNPNQDTRCSWRALEEYRKENEQFDEWLRKQLSLVVENPRQTYPTPSVIWHRFKKIFTTVYDMLCYKPVFEDYVYQILKELYTDNVMYTELRGTFMPLYELDGRVYNNKEFFEILIKTVAKFKEAHPKFVGVRYIHSIYRGVTHEVLKSGLDELIQLSKIFPKFIAGFDFVGWEEEGKLLVEYRKELLEASKYLKFFFHAGETNWFGYNDLNLVDAILLNTSRIGHGFGLPKHPVLVDMARNQGIPLELCPISNQVLMLYEDPRNHPLVQLMSRGFPVVICNDDPSVWGATGLSYDWYVAFMAMTSENSGIEVLKKFAMDSIIYSSLMDDEKKAALKEWNLDWQRFLDSILMSSD